MSKAAELAALIGSQSSLANRNMIINGDMAVAQRGTSVSIVHDGTSNGYAPDRFYVAEVQCDELEGTLEQVAVTDLGGFNNALKWTTTEPESAIGSNEILDICQKIEGQNCQRLAYGSSSAKRATLSFWVKSSVTGTYAVNFYKDDSAGDLTTKNFSSTYTISSADTWEKKTITVPADTATSGGITDDTGEGLRISWQLAVGSDFTSQDTSSAWTDYTNAGWAYGHAQNGVVTTDNATWFLTGVQFEIGDVATPFQYENFAENLDKCYRYHKSMDVGASTRMHATALADTTTRARFVIHHNPEMRTTPTVSEFNADIGGADCDTIATVGSEHLNDVILTRASGSHSSGDILDVHQGANTMVLTFDAEF